ncbi:MAG: carbon-nitrogen hydrolase family protein [Candidatus Latescibacteria bacterium]|nr:carbon-nitrogen hydrolase family protein [Candidatus Latescibacterota bacterium]
MSTIRIGVAQVPQTTSIEKNLDKALKYIEKAKSKDIELLCFPETHLSGYRVGVLTPDAPCKADELAHALESVRSKCAELSIGVIIGTETPNPGDKPFNSAVVIDEYGKILAVHHKSKLTPKDALGYAFPDTGPTAFTFKSIPMGLVICFEGYRFPETARELALGGAKIVFHPQFNHVMESMKWKLPVQESLIVSRAAENQIYFVSANMCHPCNNCRSLVVAPNGLIQEASVLTLEMLLVANLDSELATHAFLKDDLETMAKALGEV